MNILVINCGSSSLKYQLIQSDTETVLAKGICERIGLKESRVSYEPADGTKEITAVSMPTHSEAVRIALDMLTNKQSGVIKTLEEIGAVGHRVAHGGEFFTSSTLLNEKAIKAVADCCEIAPLHNPPSLCGIYACKELMPEVPMAAVFDTAFHQTMPKKAYLYGFPYEYYEKYKVRRYGFHGTSHSYVAKRAAALLGKPAASLKTIVCHLGNGSSITAVEYGKSIDTTMGFTPLEGLVMGTRSGNIDPAALQYLMHKENLDIDDMLGILNKKSGVYGISGRSSDFRDLEEAEDSGSERAADALEIFAYQCAKFIGGYTAAMKGVDAIVFTAGIGENDKNTRKRICEYLCWLGIRIDDAANSRRGEEMKISTADSNVTVMVIPTNEELEIARETLRLIMS
jgi:acetate kinase